MKLSQDFRVGAIDVKIGRGFEGRDKFGRVVALDHTGWGGKYWDRKMTYKWEMVTDGGKEGVIDLEVNLLEVVDWSEEHVVYAVKVSSIYKPRIVGRVVDSS